MKSRVPSNGNDLSPLNNTLQTAVEEGLSKAVEIFFEKLLEQKLEEKGITLSAKKLRQLAEHIKSGRNEPFKLPDRNKQGSVELNFTKEDLKKISNWAEEFTDKQISSLIPKLAETTAESILKRLKTGWREEGGLQAQELEGFRERMELRWGEPLGQLRMLLTMVREWSQTTSARHAARSSKKNDLTGILIRLMVRGCQISDEIICLLENGFPDGAMARWRTLHEVAVVAAVLREYGAEIVERYLEHQFVESKRAMGKYEETSVLLGYRALSKSSKDQIQRNYDRVITKYGESFKSDYCGALNSNDPMAHVC